MSKCHKRPSDGPEVFPITSLHVDSKSLGISSFKDTVVRSGINLGEKWQSKFRKLEGNGHRNTVLPVVKNVFGLK